LNFISRNFGIIGDILLELNKKKERYVNIVEDMTSNSNLKRSEVEALVRLCRRFGFIKDIDGEILCISNEGQEFLKYIFSLQEKETEEYVPDMDVFDESSISITLPHFCHPIPLHLKNQITFTFETMKRVIADAQKILYISTPNLDLPLLQGCFENVTRKPNATVKILTSEDKLIKYKSHDNNFILNEIGKLIRSRFKNGQIFYLKKDMSISHAKIFCSETSLFIGSANLKKDSITENFEAGIYTERKDLINVIAETIDLIIDSDILECILNTDGGKGN